MTRQRVCAYIGLGANVGDAERTLAATVGALAGLPGTGLRGVSRLYLTRPIGVVDQAEFRNAVVALDVSGEPDPTTAALRLLGELKALEREAGRRRRRRWGPRELDLDLLIFGRARIAVERPPGSWSLDAPSDTAPAARQLVVPHPLAARRLFVLAPLADLAPGLVPPGWASTVETVRRHQLELEGADSVRVIGAWDPAARAWRPLQPR